MEGFTLIDGLVALVIVLSAILAYSRGFVREAMAIAGWVGAAFLAFLFAPSAQPLIKEIPVLGDFLGDSCELSIIAAFAAVFAVGLVLASLFTPLFSSVVQRSVLGGLDQGMGFLFGVVRGVLLVGVAFLVYARHATDGEHICVSCGRLVVEREDAGRLSRIEFAGHAIRVEGPSGHCSLVSVRGGGRSAEVGRYVRADLRPVLAQEIRRALQGA